MEANFRLILLCYICRDKIMLNRLASKLSVQDWEDSREESIVAKVALRFFRIYEEPVGMLLRSEVETELDNTPNLGEAVRAKVQALLRQIEGKEIALSSAEAIENKVLKLKRDQFFSRSIEKIIDLQAAGTLTNEKFGKICQLASEYVGDDKLHIVDYFSDEELDKRIERRLVSKLIKYPLTMIDPLDDRTEAIGKGELGFFLAPFNSGKSLGLAHLADAYTKQGLDGIHFTLEDPPSIFEDRLDASLTYTPLDELNGMSERLRKKFLKLKSARKGQLKIVDARGGGWTLARMEQVVDKCRNQGFIADFIDIDYDDEVEVESKSEKRFEMAELYSGLIRFAVRKNAILWTAAQGTADSEQRRILSGSDIAEAKGKIRKATMAIGIGKGNSPDSKYLQVMRHRHGKSRFGVEICTAFEYGLFYDREKTLEYESKKNKETSADAA
jgi:hypothetical protein